ncbi:peptidoglycan editing factor PgeF [Oleispirillum naphthae]|uniref:peptidoglycan editing factor PgeF n=1 Tax=Oleispirillum naphthae TaxID=2838853 RepID=UPI0030825F29
MITVSALNDISRVRHAFFTRNRGVSTGLFASLNCGYGSGDDPADVTRNRALAMELMEQPASALVTLHQQHTTTVITVTHPWAAEDAPVADAMVTDVPGIALGILTADCVPVLLADTQKGIVGAAHAGWKGAIKGVLEETVTRMIDLGARPGTIAAAVGPSITQRTYEVGPEFPPMFIDENPENDQFFAPSKNQGRFMFDLPAYVARKLARVGVTEVIRTPCDTCREADRFFSYRRACQNGEKDYGRCLSAIVLER